MWRRRRAAWARFFCGAGVTGGVAGALPEQRLLEAESSMRHPFKTTKNCDLLTMDVLQTNTIAAIWLPYGSYMAIIWLLYVIESKNHVGFVVIHPILGIQMKWVCNWLLMTFPQYVYTNQVWPWHILWLQWHTMAKYMFMFCVRKTNLIENLNARTSRVKFA